MIARASRVLALSLLLAAPAAAQRSTAVQARRVTVQGTVVDKMSGTPLPNTLVRLVEARRGVLSDSLGRFTIADVPVGPETIAVYQYLYEEVDLDLDLTADLEPLRVELPPGPYAIQGFDVTVDHLAEAHRILNNRRNAAATSVRVFDLDRMASSAAYDMLEFLKFDAGLQLWDCAGGAECVLRRGRLVHPRVYIDESPTIGGLDELGMYHPYELAMAEVYGFGSEIHAYTHSYMERMARSPRAVFPIGLF